MKKVLVYCETNERGGVAEVSLELCSKGRQLADNLGGSLLALVAGSGVSQAAAQLWPFGVEELFLADHPCLFPYRTLPHFEVAASVIEAQQPDIVLFGATPTGRDLAPRLASHLACGLTADCTALSIGEYTDPKTQRHFPNLLLQQRPAFGGNILATIVSPEARPQMATVRPGVMRKEPLPEPRQGRVTTVDVQPLIGAADLAAKVLCRTAKASDSRLSSAQVVVAGGYGMGSREGFELLYPLAEALGGSVGATRAAVDAGWADAAQQIGQTGLTVRPRLYIACGISGAIQHRAGMDQSAKIIAINTDSDAPINAIADYAICGDAALVVPALTKLLSQL